jgi:hypothetical protein
MRSREQYGSAIVEPWFVVGGTLGLALDLDAGALFVSANGGAWQPAFPTGLRPGATVGSALFPVVSGLSGARVRCNLGADPSRPMRHTAPAAEYRTVGATTKVCPCTLLVSLLPLLNLQAPSVSAECLWGGSIHKNV